MVALLLVLAGGCQVYDSSLVRQDAGPMRQDAGPMRQDAGPVSGECVGRVPSARPDVVDGDSVPEVLFGLRDVVLNQEAGDEWADIGFNIDGLCTARPDYASECRPVQEGTRPRTDGNEGIDNVFGAELFPLVAASVPGLEETARAAQRGGVGLPILRIRNWNGTPNDPRVDVAITQAVFTVPAEADGSPREIRVNDFSPELLDGSPAPPPAWDGNDHTYVREDTFFAADPDQPLVSDDNAYVVDNRIVVNLPDRVELLFPADGVGVVVRLTGAIAVGRISDDRTRIENVVVAGRWSALDLLRTAENVGVCMGTGEYSVLRFRLDAIMDVRSAVGSGGPEVECDAVSIGVPFTGYRLQWGGLTPGRTLQSVCDETGDAGTTTLDGGVDGG
jgi:hypothetical protein